MENTNSEPTPVAPVVQETPAEPTTPVTPVTTKSNGGNAKIFAGVIAVLVIIAAGIAAFLILNKDDSKTSKKSDTTKESSKDEKEEDEEKESEESDDSDEEDSKASDEEEDTSEDSEALDSEDEDTEESDSNSDTKSYTGNDFDFTFDYPSNFLSRTETDPSTGRKILYVYRYNPDTLEIGQSNDNINFLTIADTGFSVNNDNCEEYADLLLDSADVDILYNSTQELVDAGTTKIAGKNSCYVEVEGTVNGLDLVQTQYVFIDGDNTNFITISLTADSSNVDAFDSIVDSLDLN